MMESYYQEVIPWSAVFNMKRLVSLCELGIQVHILWRRK